MLNEREQLFTKLQGLSFELSKNSILEENFDLILRKLIENMENSTIEDLLKMSHENFMSHYTVLFTGFITGINLVLNKQ